ncbi:uncharacterized protein LOC128666681 [Bombina bombina]|uniref:uncharacterized protein LOC128666681 n=1 Tax=Bombina bombina TaxID=8345 RepID=UPI00235A4E1A|nr:uncharacterized protein LOC128666681 [Bombina bombina]
MEKATQTVQPRHMEHYQHEEREDIIEEQEEEEEEEEDEEEEEQDEEEEEEQQKRTSDLYQPEVQINWQTPLRKKATEVGLYSKHSLDSPLLIGFKQYLTQDLGVINYKQEVESVSRFLYYMDPADANTSFFSNIPQTREFFSTLESVGMSQQTVANYIKNINRFVRYLRLGTNMKFDKPKLYSKALQFEDILRDIMNNKNKNIAKQVTQRRCDIHVKKQHTPRECQHALEVAKTDFLIIMDDLQRNAKISSQNQLLVLYYLEAILLLKHLQSPCVVKNFLIGDWLKRTRHHSQSGQRFAIVAVTEHKTSALQKPTFALNKEEENWFNEYFSKIRSKVKPGHVFTKEMKKETFFVSSCGLPVYNPSNDLSRFISRFDLPAITSRLARSAMETAARNLLTDEEKIVIAQYLGHTNATVNKYYRLTPENMCSAVSLIEKMSKESSEKSCEGTSRMWPIKTTQEDERPTTSRINPPQAVVGCTIVRLNEEYAFERLVQKFPVTIDGQPPKKKTRAEFTEQFDRQCYDKWRTVQRNIRKEELLKDFTRRQPTENQIQRSVDKQGWKRNIPGISEVLLSWKPNKSNEWDPNDKAIISLVKHQSWKGLSITDVGDGKAVVTTRNFQKGEIVCDYHGVIISADEGRQLHESYVDEEKRYLFFFHDPSGIPRVLMLKPSPVLVIRTKKSLDA